MWVCLIEPRSESERRVEHETYKKVAKAVNNKLIYRALKGHNFVCFEARPYATALARDRVHFNREGRCMVAAKLVNIIQESFDRWLIVQVLRGPGHRD